MSEGAAMTEFFPYPPCDDEERLRREAAVKRRHWVIYDGDSVLVQAFPSQPRNVVGCGVGDGRNAHLVWLTPEQARDWADILIRAAEAAE